MLSRSFFIGGARYGAGAWSGDIPSTFRSLYEQARGGAAHTTPIWQVSPFHLPNMAGAGGAERTLIWQVSPFHLPALAGAGGQNVP